MGWHSRPMRMAWATAALRPLVKDSGWVVLLTCSFYTLWRTAAAWRRILRGEELAWMRLEGEDGRRQPGAGGSRSQAGEQGAMAEMNAIEIAYGEDGGAGRCL